MTGLMTSLSEDIFAVLGFAIFAILVYYLIAGVLGHRYGYGRIKTLLEKKFPALARRFRRLFQSKDDKKKK
ncbi:MAG: hypothetical protein Q4F43_04530 [Eubacteriales bacterium]|nr:hypothetical protein [Eubacteriales bacterium]